MDVFITHKRFGVLNAYKKPIIAAITIAPLIVVFVGNLQHVYAATPNESVKISAPAENEIAALAEQITQLVKKLEYSDKVAQDFVKMVSDWKDEQGRPVLVAWKQRLNQARKDYKQAKISKDQLAKVEENIAKELSQRIQKEISDDYSMKFWDLADVIKHKQAQCLGYSQLVYILGNAVGLSVQTIDVVEIMGGTLPPETGHIASIVGLTDGRTKMVDLGRLISKPFKLETEFTKVGNYWELKDKKNPLGIHRRIQILDGNGLIAAIYYNRGYPYADLGQYTKAISDYTKAIELNPKYAEAYSNRGAAYAKLGRHTQAISDYTKAIELNPKYAGAYSNRGVAYDDLGQHTKAISDYTKAIELNPKYAEAYSSRGAAYTDLGQHTQAISDCTKAIELNPKYAGAYSNRGNAYYGLGQHTQAISDYTKAIELNPKFAEAYSSLGAAYGQLGEYTKALSDFTKAIELNPKFAQAYANRGAAYAFLGKLEEAKKDLLKAVELNPASKAHVKRISDQFKLNLSLD